MLSHPVYSWSCFLVKRVWPLPWWQAVSVYGKSRKRCPDCTTGHVCSIQTMQFWHWRHHALTDTGKLHCTVHWCTVHSCRWRAFQFNIVGMYRESPVDSVIPIRFCHASATTWLRITAVTVFLVKVFYTHENVWSYFDYARNVTCCNSCCCWCCWTAAVPVTELLQSFPMSRSTIVIISLFSFVVLAANFAIMLSKLSSLKLSLKKVNLWQYWCFASKSSLSLDF